MLADKFSDLADENHRLQEQLQTISKKLTASEQQAADFAQNLAELNEQKQEGYTERPQATGATAPDTRFF
jgi:Skp family chaperone for outer membrane proteins